jgi:hypothetical protein
MLPSSRGGRVELILSLASCAGIFATAVAFQLPEAGGYARIGLTSCRRSSRRAIVSASGCWPRCSPAVGASASQTIRPSGASIAFLWGAFAWVSAGLFAQMALIQNAGFAIAAMVLYAAVARGFGSTRWARDLVIGLVLGVAVYLFFVRFLNVNLPAGWLRPLLGTAGI